MMSKHHWPCLFAILIVGLMTSAGCPGPETEEKKSAETQPKISAPLRILLIDEPEMKESLQRHWSAQNRGELKFTEQTSDEFLADTLGRPDADVIIYPSSMLGELVERKAIASLPENVLRQEAFELQDVFPLESRAVSLWGSEVYGVSLGTPQYVLVYRQDVFESLGLVPPKTWDDYGRAVDRLNRHLQEDESTDLEWATCEPLSTGWAAKTLIVRSAAYVRHHSRYSALFDYVTFEPLIDRLPFQRALEEIIRVRPGDQPLMSPSETLAAVVEGKSAMALTVIPPGSTVESGSDEVNPSIAISPIPGSRQFFSFQDSRWEPRGSNDDGVIPVLGVEGRMASVVNLSRRSGAAYQFLTWLAGTEMPPQILTRCNHVTLFRDSQKIDESAWSSPLLPDAAKRQYVETAADGMSRNVWMHIPRFPQAHKFVAELDGGVRQVIEQDVEPSEALSAVKKRWITLTSNAEEFAERYQASLGLD